MNRIGVLFLAVSAVAIAACSSTVSRSSSPTPATVRVAVLTDGHPTFVTSQPGAYEVSLDTSACPIDKGSGFRLSLLGRLHGDQLVDSDGPGGHGLPGVMTLPADSWTVVLTAHSAACAPWSVSVRSYTARY
jgi:hypothetical protein